MLAYLFCGQGSQKRGMGEGLFDQVPEFADVEREVDQCLGYSMRRLCLDNPDNRLRETRFTQPSLYVVNALYYYKAIRAGERPDFLAGHSFGEYNALLAAGAFDFLTGLRLIKSRGEIMARAKDGGMAAVVGLEPERLADLLRQHGFAGLDIANYNSPAQTVISGSLDDIKRAGPVVERAGAALYMPLQVSAAFHSRYMADAARDFADVLASYDFKPLTLPVIANVTAEPYPPNDSNGALKDLLVAHMTRSVLWTQSIRYLIRRGVTTFSEVGPGIILTKMVRDIRASADRTVSASAITVPSPTCEHQMS